MTLADELAELQADLARALAASHDQREVEELRVAYLGRSGKITEIRRGIGKLPAGDRPAAGKTINDAVSAMEAEFAQAERRLALRALDASLQTRIDVTLGNTPAAGGSLHPTRRTMQEMCAYFERHGFAVLLGPEVETERHSFDALNIPPDHPARDGFDTMELGAGWLLRPHTSPMQIRAMEAHPAPIAVVTPGKVYRRDALDARHLYQFHQVEGLMVGEGIHMGHLRGMLVGMCRELFGPAQQVRFRPSYFPFTEPSAEIDTTCPACHGAGCRTCGGSGWIEIGGSGMVHPNVLRAVGYDPDLVSGWAFGCGVERIAFVRYGMSDIRAFVENAPDFLEALA